MLALATYSFWLLYYYCNYAPSLAPGSKHKQLMTEATKASAFQQAIEAVEALSLEDQTMLLDILHKRLRQQRRNQLLQEIAEVRQDYAQGNVRYGSVAEFLAELDD